MGRHHPSVHIGTFKLHLEHVVAVQSVIKN